MISFKVPRPLSERYYSPCRFFYVWHAVSYRDLKEILEKRGVKIDHAILNRWVVRYLTSLVMAAKNRKCSVATSWRMDETTIKIRGAWVYLNQAVDLWLTPLISCSPNTVMKRRLQPPFIQQKQPLMGSKQLT